MFTLWAVVSPSQSLQHSPAEARAEALDSSSTSLVLGRRISSLERQVAKQPVGGLCLEVCS